MGLFERIPVVRFNLQQQMLVTALAAVYIAAFCIVWRSVDSESWHGVHHAALIDGALLGAMGALLAIARPRRGKRRKLRTRPISGALFWLIMLAVGAGMLVAAFTTPHWPANMHGTPFAIFGVLLGCAAALSAVVCLRIAKGATHRSSSS